MASYVNFAWEGLGKEILMLAQLGLQAAVSRKEGKGEDGWEGGEGQAGSLQSSTKLNPMAQVLQERSPARIFCRS